MFNSLKVRLTEKFPPGTHQLSLLYDEVMDHLGLSGIEGEEAAYMVMQALEYECFLEVKRCILPNCPDMFEMVGPLDEGNDGRDYRRSED